jgi:Phosphopantetheinyl transferase
MALLKKHTTLLLGIWKIEETEAELLNRLDQHDAYSLFLTKCKLESRKKEWLATRVLLKEVLGEECVIAHHPDGAPYLPDRPDMSISISHTKGYVAVYCKVGTPAGIDVEYRADRILKIKHKFMSEDELAMIDPENETGHLLICWCAKETLFKLIRQEEVDFRSHLHIRPFAYGLEGQIKVRETKTHQSGSFILNYLVTPDIVLTFNR